MNSSSINYIKKRKELAETTSSCDSDSTVVMAIDIPPLFERKNKSHNKSQSPRTSTH
jgi:hypothetical protein